MGMNKLHNSKLSGNAQRLRREMTKEERHLWYDYLRTYPVKFLRQKTIGRYIVDFYCAEAQIVVELDGSQHSYEQNKLADEERTRYLQEYGITVLRIANNQVFLNFRGVCEYIDGAVRQSLRPR